MIPYWRNFWKMHTVHANVVGVVLTAVSASTINAAGVAAFGVVMSVRVVLWLAFAVFCLSLVGALIEQQGSHK